MRWAAVGMALALYAAPAMAQNASSKGATTPFDFRGVSLGISLSEMRAFRPREVYAAEVVCSPDPVVDSISYFDVHLTEEERSAGVVKCAYYDAGISYTAKGFGLGSGYAVYDYEFAFFPPQAGAEPQLYKIVLRASFAARREVLSALTDRFGPPTKTVTDEVHTAFGGVLPRQTTTWTNRVSRIDVRAPSGQVDEMLVVYRLNELATRAETAIAAAKRAQPSRM